MNCNILVAILGFNWILKIYMLLFNFRFRILYAVRWEMGLKLYRVFHDVYILYINVKVNVTVIHLTISICRPLSLSLPVVGYVFKIFRIDCIIRKDFIILYCENNIKLAKFTAQ